jgi:hypothetical protein
MAETTRLTLSNRLPGLVLGFALAIASPLAATVLSAAEPATGEATATQPPVSARFAVAEVAEEPDFRRHLVPLMSKQGCNGRACHGSFQGQGNFRLSLFGYDFDLDHSQLTSKEEAKADEPRVLTSEPEESLAVLKPLLEVPHKGGRRMEKDTWEYRVWINWIKAGAKNVPANDTRKVTLDVEPKELAFTSADETTQLKVLARWSDGVVEDVTPLCRYTTNDEQLASVSEQGLVTSGDAGDTHIVVTYDNAVVPIPVIRPVSPLSGDSYPEVPTPTEIDRLVVQKWKKLGLVPSAVSDDAEFLRRVSIDMIGTLPTVKEVEAFLADSSADKRARKIDELLERPAYAAWWATRLSDFTGNNQNQLNNLNGLDANRVSQDWHDWLRVRLEKNMPYDELVAGIVLAKSRKPDDTLATYSARMSGHYHPDAKSSYAETEDLTWYWARRNFRQPDDRALSFAYTFLGIRIQCAQCHKHPFDQWSQQDFKEFTGFFKQAGYGVAPKDRKGYEEMLTALEIDKKKMNGGELRRELSKRMKAGETVPFEGVFLAEIKAAPAKGKKADKDKKKPQPAPVQTARVLGGEKLDLSGVADVREPLMAWMRSPENPYFARAIVNRVWANYFNVGIVQPTDDLSLANPPSNKPLLDYLAQEFIAHKFDLKWLHRTIANSRVYQLGWKPNETNLNDLKNFSRAVPRRLPAEAAYDAILLATASDSEAERLSAAPGARAVGQPGTATSRNANAEKKSPISNYVLTVFGKSIRDSNCDCDRSNEASLLQKVWIANDGEMLALIDRKDGFVQQVLRGNADQIKEAQKTAAQAKANKKPGKKTDKSAETLNYDNLITLLERRIARLKKKDDKAGVEVATAKLAELKAKRAAEAEKVPAEMTPEDNAAADKPATDKPAGEAPVVAETKPEATSPTVMPIEEAVTRAYLRTLGRHPTEQEKALSLAYFHAAANPQEGIRGVVWALLNTKEFIVNH